MEKGKYIIVESRRIEVAILFDSLISHSDFAEMFPLDLIVSAGFFEVGAAKETKKTHEIVEDSNDVSVSCWGKSVSLKKDSRPEDAALIKRVVRKEYQY